MMCPDPTNPDPTGTYATTIYNCTEPMGWVNLKPSLPQCVEDKFNGYRGEIPGADDMCGYSDYCDMSGATCANLSCQLYYDPVTGLTDWVCQTFWIDWWEFPTCVPDSTKPICMAPVNGVDRGWDKSLFALAATNGVFFRVEQ